MIGRLRLSLRGWESAPSVLVKSLAEVSLGAGNAGLDVHLAVGDELCLHGRVLIDTEKVVSVEKGKSFEFVEG